jgi:hypothetical protein
MRFWLTFFIGFVFAHFLSIWHEEEFRYNSAPNFDYLFFYTPCSISDLNVHNYISFVTHNHSRLCRNPNLLLKTPLCKTTTYQNSYFNRIVKLWNSVCKVAPPNTFSSVKTFKYYLFNHSCYILKFNSFYIYIFNSQLLRPSSPKQPSQSPTPFNNTTPYTLPSKLLPL